MEADELHAGEVTLLVLCSPVWWYHFSSLVIYEMDTSTMYYSCQNARLLVLMAKCAIYAPLRWRNFIGICQPQSYDPEGSC
jgi:hypothetical protein